MNDTQASTASGVESTFLGLTSAEAARRLAEGGPNELPEEKKRGLVRTVIEVLREPMFLMLVAAGALYAMMGEVADALMLGGSVGVIVVITIVQERRTERALDALRDLSSPRALVIRDGVRVRIAGREVVPGDLLVLAEGDRVPADAILRTAMSLATDESLLTGESVPVRKVASSTKTALERPGGDDLASVFGGTLVTAGQGIAEVIATGARSEIGAIGRALHDVVPSKTPLQRETGRLVRRLAVFGVAACAVVTVAFTVTRGGGTQALVEGLLAGITMAIGVVPEEFPVVLTVFLALGAYRISRRRVLTRRIAAVETLGAATVLCVDKTGTLTENRMTLRALARLERDLEIDAGTGELPADLALVLEHAVLASKRDAFDPMERALHGVSAERLAAQPHDARVLVHEYPLSPELLAVGHVYVSEGSEAKSVSAKGAPEAIAGLCRLDASARAAFDARAASLASRGLRVLAVARGVRAVDDLPESLRDVALEFVGFVAFEDPLRANVPAAVAECRTAGVRVVMITGDYAVTARNIATRAGIENADDVLTGDEIEAMDDDQLGERIGSVGAFARVVPRQKLRIVELLKKRGETVAMTGDGVNDAPALEAAHIGIAMGGRGTDVARESAALVLLDDDFASIVVAMRLGRRIFDNLTKAIGFIFAVHVPIIGLSLLPAFLASWPLLLLPVHVAFLELIIDPSCTLIYEAEEEDPDVMKRPPRPRGRALYSRESIVRAVAQGLSVFVACVVVFVIARADHSTGAARSLTFTTLVFAFLVIIVANRSATRSLFEMIRVPNAAFRFVVIGTLLVMTGVMAVPAARRLFHFEPVHLDDVVLAVAAGGLAVAWLEGTKVLGRLRRS